MCQGESKEDRLFVQSSKASELSRLTLTNLYNRRPAWLANAYAGLDAVAASAYGFDSATPDEEILARLLELNRAQA
jgi:hypothetical protein